MGRLLNEYFGQRVAATVLVLTALVLLGVFENVRISDLVSVCSGTADTAASLDRQYAAAIPRLTDKLIMMGDGIAEASGADKASKAAVRAWYAARYELLASKEIRARLEPVVNASAESKKIASRFSSYIAYKEMVLVLALLIAIVVFFVFNIEREYKFLLLGNAGLAAILFGFLIAITLWIFDLWPKAWYPNGDEILILLAGGGLLSALLWRARKTFALGADAQAPGRFMSADFFKMAWLSAPVFYITHLLVLCVMAEGIMRTGVIENNLGSVFSALFAYLVLAFLALPLRIRSAASRFGRREGV